MGVKHCALACALATACGPASRPRPVVVAAVGVECAPTDARIMLDEVDQGACILWRGRYFGLTEGAHRLRVERDGYLPFERDLPPTRGRQRIAVQLRAVPE